MNPIRDEVTLYKVDPQNDDDESIMKLHTAKDFGNITCLDYSYFDVGLIAVGEKNGFVRLFNIIANDDPELQTIDMKARAKQQRCINTLGINSNGLVAMGLDRNKNDASLQIWDINYQSTDTAIVTPTFSYCVNENIVSSKFFNDTGLIVASTKFLKEIDLRSPQPAYQHPTRLSYDVKVNPFNDCQFSSYGDDGTLAIWDRRKLAAPSSSGDVASAEPLLTFEKLVGMGAASKKYMNSCFRWSTTRNKEFATLHRGDTIKRWWIGSCGEEGLEENETEELFVSKVHDVRTTFDKVVTFDYIPQDNNRISLLCMRQSGTVYRMPVHQSYSASKFNNYNSLMLSNCEVPYIDEIRMTTTKQKSNFENTDLTNLSFEDLDISDNYSPSVKGDEDSLEEKGYSEKSDVESQDQSTKGGSFSVLWKPEKLLQKDIRVIMKSRALLGYGLDPVNTVAMIDGSKTLQNNAYIRNTWRWLAIAKSSVDDGTMVSGDLDLGYEGVLGIWNGLNGISNQNRFTEENILTDQQLDKEMEKIIKLRRKQKRSQGNKGTINRFSSSSKSIQRKLCLILSGWDLSPNDLEEKYSTIIQSENYEKAAAWAVFFGDIPKAVEILGSAKKERLRLIATAIAGYMAYKDESGNNAWRQQCRRMASELEDPYLRVIFAFIADNDWWDILYEPAISLRERLGVALRFLNDYDLTRFLERTASTVIENGELEGLILTGITPSGIDLLQSYVNKTSDVQSAAMISIFGCPRYFRDERVDEWVQTYREMLNSWEIFTMRAKFDCTRTKLSRTSGDQIRSRPKPRQVYMQCVNCKKNINDRGSTSNLPSSSTQTTVMADPNGSNPSESMNYRAMSTFGKPKKYGMTNNISPSGSKHKKHSCPHCGTPFPRCVICLLPLGTSNLPFAINGVQQDPTQDGAASQDNSPIETNGSESKEETQRNSTMVGHQLGIVENNDAKRLKMNEWFSFCLSCNHGMHAGHAEEWFERHDVCPAPGCSCHCNK